MDQDMLYFLVFAHVHRFRESMLLREPDRRRAAPSDLV
jgi:hypothetical protein